MNKLESRAAAVVLTAAAVMLFHMFFVFLSGCHPVDYRGMMRAEYARCDANVAAIGARENSTLEADERDLSLEERRCHAAQARICAASARAAERPEGCVPDVESTDEP